MQSTHQVTALIEREENGYVALKPLSCSSRWPAPPRCRSDCIRRCTSHALRYRLARLRALSGREVCRILAQQVFMEVRRRGSHIVMQRQIEGYTITVPVPDHAELSIGTLQSIIRQSRLPRSLFETEL